VDKATEELFMEFVSQGFDVLEKAIEEDDKASNQIKVTPAALCLAKEGLPHQLVVLPWSDDESKIIMLEALGEKCFKEKLYQVFLINDAAMKQYDRMPDEVTETPLSYPPNMRVDCLMVTCLDFKKEHSEALRVFPYTINNGAVIRKEEFIFGEGIIKANSLLVNHIMLGFLKTAMLDEYLRQEMHGSVTEEVALKLYSDVSKNFPGVSPNNGPSNI
jgi:hypothetical protein